MSTIAGVSGGASGGGPASGDVLAASPHAAAQPSNVTKAPRSSRLIMNEFRIGSVNS
jgi:hypothetical protein